MAIIDTIPLKPSAGYVLLCPINVVNRHSGQSRKASLGKLELDNWGEAGMIFKQPQSSVTPKQPVGAFKDVSSC